MLKTQQPGQTMKIIPFEFGNTKSGEKVQGYTLENSNQLSISVINWGATLISVKTPDKSGAVEEITLGFNNFPDYEEYSSYFGSTVGRVANRIQGGRFLIGDQEFQLDCNERGVNHIHGGFKGLSKIIWELTSEIIDDSAMISCRYLSIDGEEGYPGELDLKVSYTLTESNELLIDYQAMTDKACPVNLTNHAYWNLTGNREQTVLDHEMTIYAESFLPVDENLIPTGEFRKVAETPWDFRSKKTIGLDIEKSGGFDHCYVRSMERGNCDLTASVYEPISGRVMKVFTTEPGIQFYSGNFLDRISEKGLKKHDGFCLEAQFFPNAVNQSNFPSIILNPGEIYTQQTIHSFEVK